MRMIRLLALSLVAAHPMLLVQRVSSAEETLVNSIGMKMALVPAGEYMMGSKADDAGARPDEQPRHRVRLSRGVFFGIHEVTQGEYLRVMGSNPAFFSATGPIKDQLTEFDTKRFPVENVSWHNAVAFCRKLSNSPAEKRARRAYRLPTEAEWEYACRGGTTTIFAFGDQLSSQQANFNGAFPFGAAAQGRFLNRTTTVGSYSANGFGLFDMHGNVNEWCADRFGRTYYAKSPRENPLGAERGTPRVIRGGDWYSDGRDLRSAFRYADIPDGTFYAIGFRVVCVPDADVEQIWKPFLRQPPAGTAKASDVADAAPNSGMQWGRWRGPHGDGRWQAPPLANKQPLKNLETRWRRNLGGGYGGIAAIGGRVFVMDRITSPNEQERVLCFDGVSGRPLWTRAYPTDYSNVSYANGPRATPTVHEDRVYALGATGMLHCLRADNGAPIWKRDLTKEYRAKIPLWGLSGSPVVYRDLLIVHAGGADDACYIAFDLATGKERWRSLSDPAGYSTPLLVHRGRRRQLVCWTPTHVRGLNPDNGKPVWSIPFEVNYGTSIADPIQHEDLVLVSSYYEGAKAIRVGDNGAQVVWEDRRNLRALMSQPLERGGYAYLIDKRHGLTCVDIATGKKLWDDDNRMTPKGRNPQATMIWTGSEDRALTLNSEGDLIVARLRPGGYNEEDRRNIIGPTWAHPAYAGNCVFARSDTEIVCVVLPRVK